MAVKIYSVDVDSSDVTRLADTVGLAGYIDIQNLGPNKITLCDAQGTLGREIAATASWAGEIRGAIYALAATADQSGSADTRVYLSLDC